jgi:hypothetical protein
LYDEPQQERIPFEEEPEMEKAREALAQDLFSLINPSKTELNWEKLLFEKEEEER